MSAASFSKTPQAEGAPGSGTARAVENAFKDVCPRESIEKAASEVCPKEAIERSSSSVVCAKKKIDESVQDICDRKSIEHAVASVVCAKREIEEDAGSYECKRGQIERDVQEYECARARIDEDAANACPKSSPVIGIVPTQMPEEHLLRVNDHYINSIVLSGGVPLILPLTNDKRVYERLFSIVDGFVLTGGQDVDPERYGIDPDNPVYEKVSEITPMRDRVENLILDYSYKHDVPLLGICRGMQTMNVFFGGTLYVDLAEEFDGRDSLTNEPIQHWQSEEPTETSHYIRVVRGSKLGQALGTHTAAANSFHHQGVKDIADNMTAVAYGADGLVEAIEASDMTFMLGVQWHPEFFLGEKHTGNLFAMLVKEASAARASGRLERNEGFELNWCEGVSSLAGRDAG